MTEREKILARVREGAENSSSHARLSWRNSFTCFGKKYFDRATMVAESWQRKL